MVLPLDVLEKSLNQRMQLHLKDGRLIEGKLVGYDPYMNVVLEESSEKTPHQERSLGTVILRGNNVVAIAEASSSRSGGPESRTAASA